MHSVWFAGVSIFDWETDILPLIRQNEDDPLASSTTTVHTLPRSRQSFQPYPSPLERSNIEVNDFVVHKDVVYGAAGDLFGCYKWDLETAKVVTTYSRYRDHMSQQFNATVRYNPSTPGTPVGGYMHTVTLVPNTNLILTGGEDGIVGMWDIDADQFVDELNVGKGLAEYCTSTSSRPLLGNDSHPNRRSAAAAAAPTVAAKNDDYSDRWISSCVARDENWWIVAGGSNHSVGGHVSTWHGPSRRLVSCVCTRETPQQLALLRDGDIANSNGIGTPSSTLLSVANESYVSYWSNPLVLDSPDRQRVWCNQASGYAIAVSCDGQHIATGGVGSVVDVYEKGTGCSSQLSTR